jgi:DNA-nicking Smr family endonuclease
MSRRRSLNDDERELWRGYVRSITPLRPSEARDEPAKDELANPKKPAAPPQAGGPGQASAPIKKAPPLAPLGRRLKQRVARGREPIEARLDLHGYTQAEAHTALLRFLHRAQADGVKTALIVTGKGSARGVHDAAGDRGVLKRAVPMWLALPEFRAMVIGFEAAHVGHGGEGALYIRLRRR